MPEVMNIKVARKNPDPKKLVINLIQLSLFKDDRKGMLTLVAYPAEDRGTSIGVMVTNGDYAEIEPMKRLDNKRIATVSNEVIEQVKNKEGKGWDLVQKIITQNDLILV